MKLKPGMITDILELGYIFISYKLNYYRFLPNETVVTDIFCEET
jgi:hypothetical protein